MGKLLSPTKQQTNLSKVTLHREGQWLRSGIFLKVHSPPSTLIMKKGGWVVGSMNKTVLLNKEGNEEAVRLSKEERKSSGSYRSDYGTARPVAEAEKSCVVM